MSRVRYEVEIKRTTGFGIFERIVYFWRVETYVDKKYIGDHSYSGVEHSLNKAKKASLRFIEKQQKKIDKGEQFGVVMTMIGDINSAREKLS